MYAKQHSKEYTIILCMNYVGDLRQNTIDIDFANDFPKESDDVRFKRHNRFLRSLREDNLLIVDNFNVTRDQDEFQNVILKYRCRIVFTTCSRYENQISLEVKELPADTPFALIHLHVMLLRSWRTALLAIPTSSLHIVSATLFRQ